MLDHASPHLYESSFVRVVITILSLVFLVVITASRHLYESSLRRVVICTSSKPKVLLLFQKEGCMQCWTTRALPSTYQRSAKHLPRDTSVKPDTAQRSVQC